jgi:F0F1-type ATP synthase assembly protein I
MVDGIMSEIDEIKEFIGYLKVIFALILATIIGLIGWLVQNYQEADPILLYADIVFVLSLFVVLFFVHRKILSDIKRLRGL